MERHKLPTQVEIASSERKTEFHEWVERYWKPAAAICLVAAVAVLVRQWMAERAIESAHQSWDTLRKELVFSQPGGTFELPSEAALVSVSTRLESQPPAAWALALLAQKQLESGEWDKADATLASLRQKFPQHPLVTQKLETSAGSEARSLADQLGARVAAQRAWHARNPGLYANPAAPEGSPRVRLKTSAGAIVVALYQQQAPKHVEHFLELCRSSYYVGTKFHRVVAGSLVEGGDPNSKEGAVETWGRGGGDQRLEAEHSELRHFPGVLSSGMIPGESQDSGSLFLLTVGPAHQFDDERTVFGTVIEGKDVLESIASAKCAQGTERPETPIAIEACEVL